MYTQGWHWIGMSKRDNGYTASPYSLEAYSGHLPAHLRSEVIPSFSYYSRNFLVVNFESIESSEKYNKISKIMKNCFANLNFVGTKTTKIQSYFFQKTTF